MLSQDTTHLIQRPCHQQGSPCQDPAGNWTTRRPDHCKETQTAVIWSCFPFIRSSQNHLARHSERGKKTRQTEEEVGRQYQEMDRPGVRQVPEGSGEQGKMEKTGCKIICGAPTTLAVKGLMMMMMIIMMMMMMISADTPLSTEIWMAQGRTEEPSLQNSQSKHREETQNLICGNITMKSSSEFVNSYTVRPQPFCPNRSIIICPFVYSLLDS